MKNLIYMVLMMLIMSSCQSKKNIEPASEGSLFIRFVDKNEVNKQYSSYSRVQVLVNPEYTQGSNGRVFVGIKGCESALNEFNTTISILRDNTKPRSFYDAGANGMGTTYAITTNKSNENKYLLVSVPSNNVDERLIITKDDADSLSGKFKIRLVDDGVLNTGMREMEGYFSVAKKGRF